MFTIWSLIGKSLFNSTEDHEKYYEFAMFGVMIAIIILLFIAVITIKLLIRGIKIANYLSGELVKKPKHPKYEEGKQLEEMIRGREATTSNYFLAYLKLNKKQLFIYMLITVLTYLVFVGGY